MKVKSSGPVNWLREANRAPPNPAKAAPMAKAMSFCVNVLIPMARETVSSSRMASQARPTREFCKRLVTKMINIAARKIR